MSRPEPEFDMDEDRTYLETTIYMRDGFKVSDKMSDEQAPARAKNNPGQSAASNGRHLPGFTI